MNMYKPFLQPFQSEQLDIGGGIAPAWGVLSTFAESDLVQSHVRINLQRPYYGELSGALTLLKL